MGPAGVDHLTASRAFPRQPHGRASRRAALALVALTLLPSFAFLAQADMAAVQTYLPTTRFATSAVWTGTYAYVFGGHGGSVYYDDVVKFDPVAGTAARTGALLPRGLAYTTAVYDGSRYAYVFGGSWLNGSTATPSDQIVRYDTQTNTVSVQATTLPVPLTEAAAVFDGTYAYVIGGYNSGGFRSTIYRYDPATDTVTDTGAALPSGRSTVGAAWANGKAYVFGGLNGCAPTCAILKDVLSYDPSTNAVTNHGQLVTAGVAYGEAAWSGQHVYLFSGYGSDGAHAYVDRFDPSTLTFSRMSAGLPFARNDAAAVWANGQGYVFGGVSGLFGGTRTSEIVRFNATQPPAPTGLSAATGPGSGKVSLSWGIPHVDADLAGFRVFRRPASGGADVLLATTDASARSYVDTGPKTGVTYTYTVAAYTAQAESPRSNGANGIAYDYRFVDDMESGAAKWTVTNASGNGAWDVTTARWSSATHSFAIRSYGADSNDTLQTSAPIDLTRLASGSATLSVRMFVAGERTCLGACVNSDYGRVEVSPDNGATWTTLETNLYTTSGGWVTKTYSLEAVRGSYAHLRFVWVSDSVNQFEGWYVDDVVVQGHTNDAPIASFAASANGLSVSVNATASTDPDADALAYTWDWGDGTAAGSGATATHAYATSGIYTVRLTVSDGRGATDSRHATLDLLAAGRVNRLVDDMENGTSKWTVTNVAGAGTWAITTARSASPTRSFAITGYGAGSSDLLQTAAPVDLTNLGTDAPPVLRFRHYAVGETTCNALGTCAPADFGRVEVSADAGASWTALLDGVTSTAGAWKTEQLSLAAYVGQQVLLRFAWTSNGANAFDGWFLDDVQVVGSTNLPPVAALSLSVSGRTVTANASATTDPDGDALTYAWTWGDDATTAASSNPVASRTYAADGSYLVKLTVSDGRGGVSVAYARATVAPSWYVFPLLDTMESGASGWTVADNGGAGAWALNTTRSWSPGTSFAITGYGPLSDDTLTTATPIDLTTKTSAVLEFRHYASGETACQSGICVIKDSGSVQVSTDNGGNWTSLKSSIYTTNGAFARERLDLAPYLGKQVLLRFRWSSDVSGAGEGWYVDDVVVMANPNHAPVPAFTLSNGTTVTADASGTVDVDGDAITYEWNWGDGSTTPASSSPVATHAYANPFVYNVVLTVRDPKDGVASRSVFASVIPAGDEVRFTDSFENGDAQWTKLHTGGTGDWTITTSRSHTPTHSIWAGGSGSSSAAGNWTITAPVNLTNLSSAALHVNTWAHGIDGSCGVLGCTDEYLSAQVSTDGGSTWIEGPVFANTPRYFYEGQMDHWDLDPYAGTNALLRFTWVGGTSPQIYYAAFIDDVLVHGTPGASRHPIAAFDVSSGGLAVVVNGSASYDPDNTALTYAWSWGDGSPDGSGVTASHTFAAAGDYTIALTVTDASGVSRTTSRVVTLPTPNAPPVPSFTTSTSVLDVGVDASASTDPEGTALTYAWSWGDGSPDGSGVTASHSYATGGTYTITLTVTDAGGASNSTTRAVSPNRAPTAAFTWSRNANVLTVNGSTSTDPDGDALTYAWTWGDDQSNASSANPAAMHTYSKSMIYRVKLAVSDGKGGTSTTTQSIEVTLSGESLLFYDDMENGTSKWSIVDNGGAGTWGVSTYKYGYTPTQGIGIGGAGGYGTSGNDVLQIATALDLRSASSAKMNVRVYADGERTCPPLSSCVNSDYGWVDYSTNGGATWTHINTNGMVDTQGLMTSASYVLPVGSFVLVRFQWISDAAGGGTGWFLDDVAISRK